MKRLVLLSAFLVGAAAVSLAGQQHGMWQASGDRPLTLVPIAGTWNADYENAQQILTIDGTAAREPHAGALSELFGSDAPAMAKSLAAPAAYPLAVVRDVKMFKAGRLEVQFKLVAGESDQTAGVFFNLHPNGDYCYARYNTKDGNVAIWKFENGARAVLVHGELHEQLPLNQWHTLQVVVAGQSVTATANNRWRAAHTFDTPIAGRIGVWTKQDSVTSFKGFKAQGTH